MDELLKDTTKNLSESTSLGKVDLNEWEESSLTETRERETECGPKRVRGLAALKREIMHFCTVPTDYLDEYLENNTWKFTGRKKQNR